MALTLATSSGGRVGLQAYVRRPVRIGAQADAAPFGPHEAEGMRNHPVLSFAALAIAPTWAVQFLFIANGWEFFPAMLAQIVIMVGAATFVTARVDGRAGVKRLFAGAVRWRMGWWQFGLAAFAVPVTTVALGAATGTLHTPDGGWGSEAYAYLFATFVFGALFANVWEELAWAGFTQTRLIERYGLLRGSLLTAIPFALIHVGVAFGLTETTGEALAFVAVVAVAAPFYRYLYGMTLLESGGSVLAVGILHASVNATQSLTALRGTWQAQAAVLLVLAGLLAYRMLRGRRADQARLDDRGYASAGSVSTLTR
jgi:membrane protease YdiL (CAAX protease family)